MKYCAYCGSSMEDTDAFCPNCGAAANKPEANEPAAESFDNNNTAGEAEAPAEQPVTYADYTPAAPAGNTAAQESASKTALTLSIVGTVLGAGVAWISTAGAIAGIVVSAIAMSKVKSARQLGASDGKFKAANILSKIGLIASIITTVLSFIGVVMSYS